MSTVCRVDLSSPCGSTCRRRRDQRYRTEEATLIELARRGEAVYPDHDGLLDLPHQPLD
jgi:hypothetical protein